VNIMEKLRDIKVLAYPDNGYAVAEGESAEGMQFMKRQFDSLNTSFESDDINIFLESLRNEGLTFSFRGG